MYLHAARPVGDFYQIQWAQASESQPVRLAGSLMSAVFTQEYGTSRRFFHLKVGNPLAEVSADTPVQPPDNSQICVRIECSRGWWRARCYLIANLSGLVH